MLEAGVSFSECGIDFKGVSLSGIRTAIALPQHNLSFDVAQGFPFLFPLKHYFISHGHLDHAAGIPYLISQKAMNNLPPAPFYMPQSLVEPMKKIMKLWSEIEGHNYDLNFIGLEPDQDIELKGDHFIRAFPSVHRIDSLGYTLFKRQKKLKDQFKSLSEIEIIKAKNQGEEIQDSFEIPLVTFSGDTQVEFLKLRPWILKSKVLLMECTYIDSRKSVDHARNWGHTHIDEIIPHLNQLEAEKLILLHLSSRYSPSESKKILQSRLEAEISKGLSKTISERVQLFPQFPNN